MSESKSYSLLLALLLRTAAHKILQLLNEHDENLDLCNVRSFSYILIYGQYGAI